MKTLVPNRFVLPGIVKPVLVLLLLFLFVHQGIYSQNTAITDADGYVPHASAMLDVHSTTKGFLTPRISTAQRLAIAGPATGLLVFDTTEKQFFYFNGTGWTNLSAPSTVNSPLMVSDKDGYSADASAILDIQSSDKGMLIPRLTATQRASIINPANGLLVFDPEENLFYYFDGTEWKNLIAELQMPEELWYNNTDLGITYMGNLTDKLGIGTKTPAAKVMIQGDEATGDTEALFEIKNKLGETVFAVYNEGVQVYVGDQNRGVSGFSVRGIRSRGGDEYLNVTNSGVQVNVPEYDATTPTGSNRAVSGFSVRGIRSRGVIGDEFLNVSNTGVQVNIQEDDGRGVSGGFSVRGIRSRGGFSTYFDVLGSKTADAINNESRVLWYPLKEAFFVGKILVEDPTQVGLNSVATGYHSLAKGDYSQAMGYECIAGGLYSTSFGFKSQALAENSVAIGNEAVAGSIDCFALGWQAKALGMSSQAIGANAHTGQNASSSFALGFSATAMGTESIVIGSEAYAGSEASSSFALGFGATVLGPESFAFGSTASTSSTASGAFALGRNATADGNQSFAFGSDALTQAEGAFALGFGAVSTGNGCFAIGNACYSGGDEYSSVFSENSFAIGFISNAIGNNSFAVGTMSNAKGDGSFALGTSSNAQGKSSFAIGTTANTEGEGSYAMGSDAYAIGSGSFAVGDSSFAVGNGAYAVGDMSFAFGKACYAIGERCFAGGSDPESQKFYPNSFACGSFCTAEGKNTIAFGHQSMAFSERSAAFGFNACTSGVGSLAIGLPVQNLEPGMLPTCNTETYGDYSIAIGSHVETQYEGSIVIGDFSSKTNDNYVYDDGPNQFVVRASGGYAFYTSNDLSNGVFLEPGANAWPIPSDKNKKENFKLVEPEDIITKLGSFTIQSWNYKSQSPALKHIGVTAQDFYHTFGYGRSDTTLMAVDLAGVNMVAIQGLIKRTDNLKKQVNQLQLENQKLREELKTLEEVKKQNMELQEKQKALRTEIDEIKSFVKMEAKK